MTIAGSLAEAVSRHRERSRPTGLGFALADGVDRLDGGAWDALTRAGSLFLRRP